MSEKKRKDAKGGESNADGTQKEGQKKATAANVPKQPKKKKQRDASKLQYPRARIAVPTFTTQGRRAAAQAVGPAMGCYILTITTLARNGQLEVLGEINTLLNRRVDEWIECAEKARAESEQSIQRLQEELGCDIEFRELGSPAIVRIQTAGGGLAKRMVRAIKEMDSAFVALKRAHSVDAITTKAERETGHELIQRARAVRATAKRIKKQIEGLHREERLDLEGLAAAADEAAAGLLEGAKMRRVEGGQDGAAAGGAQMEGEAGEGEAGEEAKAPSRLLKRVFGG